MPRHLLVPLAQHEVQLHARRGVRGIGAAGRDLHLLEHVEVVVGRRRAERAHVGDRDAVHVPGVLVGVRALGLVVRLLTRFGAADVHAIDDDAGNGLEHDPRIARARNVLQLVEVDVGRDRLPLGLDDRRLRRDVDFLRQAADAQRDAERHDRAGVDRHVLVPVVGEPGELGGHGVAPGREVDEVRLALGVRDGDVGLRADGLDRHAGQHRAGAVLDGDVDAACVDLRRDRRRDERRADERQADQDQSCVHPILLCVIRQRRRRPAQRPLDARGRRAWSEC